MNVRYEALIRTCLICLPLAAAGCMENAIARAGADRTVEAGETVTLDGTRSKPDDSNRRSMKWEVIEGSQITLSNSTAEMATFTAPSEPTETQVRIQLTVTYVDLSGTPVSSNKDTDEVLIRVLAEHTTDDATTDGADDAATDGADISK